MTPAHPVLKGHGAHENSDRRSRITDGVRDGREHPWRVVDSRTRGVALVRPAWKDAARAAARDAASAAAWDAAWDAASAAASAASAAAWDARPG